LCSSEDRPLRGEVFEEEATRLVSKAAPAQNGERIRGLARGKKGRPGAVRALVVSVFRARDGKVDIEQTV